MLVLKRTEKNRGKEVWPSRNHLSKGPTLTCLGIFELNEFIPALITVKIVPNWSI